MRVSERWKTFLRNHADGIASMDLFVGLKGNLLLTPPGLGGGSVRKGFGDRRAPLEAHLSIPLVPALP
ncbi:MAG: hypothetical protein ABSD11_15500 [Methylocella sp.]